MPQSRAHNATRARGAYIQWSQIELAQVQPRMVCSLSVKYTGPLLSYGFYHIVYVLIDIIHLDPCLIKGVSSPLCALNVLGDRRVLAGDLNCL